MIFEEDPELLVDDNRIPLRLRWIRSSPQLVFDAEEKLFKRLQCSLQKLFVPIFDGQWKLRTIVARNFGKWGGKVGDGDCSEEKAIPMVMVHGFASGIGLWCKNLDSLARYRRVYAFDVLGFGRSSRPVFPTDAEDVEKLFVDSLEEWRAAMNLDRFILLGHSFGGYLSSVYAMRHSERIAHLILVEPWGYHETPFNEALMQDNGRRARLVRNIRRFTRLWNPLFVLRAAGPLGPSIFHRARADLRGSFDQKNPIGDSLEVPTQEDELAFACGALGDDAASSATTSFTPPTVGDKETAVEALANNKTKPLDDDIFDGTVALDYAYHINVQRPSGEVAFKTLCSDLAYAKQPLIPRIDALDASLPVTFIYGSRSWMDVSSGATVRELRPNSYVDVKTIEGGGHQVYAQYPEEFNAYVNAVTQRVDADYEFLPTSKSGESNSEHKEDVLDVLREDQHQSVSFVA